MAQVIVEGGQWEGEAQGEFQVGGVADGQPMAVGQFLRPAPGVLPLFAVNPAGAVRYAATAGASLRTVRTVMSSSWPKSLAASAM